MLIAWLFASFEPQPSTPHLVAPTAGSAQVDSTSWHLFTEQTRGGAINSAPRIAVELGTLPSKLVPVVA